MSVTPFTRTSAIVHVTVSGRTAHGTFIKLDGVNLLAMNAHILFGDPVYSDSLLDSARENGVEVTILYYTRESTIFNRPTLVKRAYPVQYYGDLLLCELRGPNGVVSPPVKPMNVHTPAYTDISGTRVLIGCLCCDKENDIDVSTFQMDSEYYKVNTEMGDCGRPIISYVNNEHWFLGVHRGTNGKANLLAVYPVTLNNVEDYDVDPKLFVGDNVAALFKDYECNEFDDFVPEGIDYVTKLPGNPSSLESDFIKDPMAKLIPSVWVDTTKYDLKEMNILNVMKGKEKYNKYDAVDLDDFENLELVLPILFSQLAPYFENFSVPEDFDTWMHVMQYGGQDAKRHSSPGFPYNKDCFDKIKWLRYHGKDLWDCINNGTILDYNSIFSLSPKDEVRAVDKDQRMFCGAPITHTGIGVYLFNYIYANAKTIKTQPGRMFRYGLSLEDMKDLFDTLFENKYCKGLSWDVNACDTTIPASILAIVLYWARINFIPEKYKDLYDTYVSDSIYTLLKLPNNEIYIKDCGNPSGHYMTTFWNIIWSLFIAIYVYVKWIKTTDAVHNFMQNPVAYFKNHVDGAFCGDDSCLVFKHAPYLSIPELKSNLPPNVSVSVDFETTSDYSRHSVTFLSLRCARMEEVPRMYRSIKTPIVHSRPDRIISKMLYKRKSHDHTVFYAKCCNALGYLLYDDSWYVRLCKLKKDIETYFTTNKLPFRFIALSDIECLRGAIKDEHGIGNILNHVSHFKTIMDRVPMPYTPQGNVVSKQIKSRGGNNNNNNNMPRKKKKKNKTSDSNLNRNNEIMSLKSQLNAMKLNTSKNIISPEERQLLKMFKATQGKSKYDDVNRAWKQVFNILMRGACTTCDPAPVACENIMAASTACVGIAQQMENFRPSNPTFEALGIMHSNPVFPVLTTDIDRNGASFTTDVAASNTIPGRSSFLEIYNLNAWGIWMDGVEGFDITGGVLSIAHTPIPNYRDCSNPHVWLFSMGNDGANTTKLFHYSLDSGVGLIFWSLDGSTWNQSEIVMGANNAFTVTGLSTVQNNIIWLAIQMDPNEFHPGTKFRMWTVTNGGNPQGLRFVNPGVDPTLPATLASAWVYNLGPPADTTYSNLAGNSTIDATRYNAGLVVHTNYLPSQNNSLLKTCATIKSNAPPTTDYLSYLYSLEGRSVTAFKRGGGYLWFSSTGDFAYRAKGTHPYNNIARPNTNVVMWRISGNTNLLSTSTTNNDRINCATQIIMDCDFSTSDVSRARKQVTPCLEDWSALMSWASDNCVFTDNPDHKKLLDIIKKGAMWFMSGDPRAAALRGKLKQYGETGAEGLLTAALSLI